MTCAGTTDIRPEMSTVYGARADWQCTRARRQHQMRMRQSRRSRPARKNRVLVSLCLHSLRRGDLDVFDDITDCDLAIEDEK